MEDILQRQEAKQAQGAAAVAEDAEFHYSRCSGFRLPVGPHELLLADAGYCSKAWLLLLQSQKGSLPAHFANRTFALVRVAVA
jgi:hypothetical protein